MDACGHAGYWQAKHCAIHSSPEVDPVSWEDIFYHSRSINFQFSSEVENKTGTAVSQVEPKH